MAGRGPLPNPNRRRTNAPTIPTSHLPAHGFKGPFPKVPAWVKLGDAGRAWWRWAWRTPQAASWGVGSGVEPYVARRAELEDRLAVAGTAAERVSLGRLAIAMDARLALDHKGLAEQRLKIIDEDENVAAVAEPVPTAEAAPAVGGNVSPIDARRARLTS